MIDLKRQAYDLLRCEKKLEIVPGVTHLFEEQARWKWRRSMRRGGLKNTSLQEIGNSRLATLAVTSRMTSRLSAAGYSTDSMGLG